MDAVTPPFTRWLTLDSRIDMRVTERDLDYLQIPLRRGTDRDLRDAPLFQSGADQAGYVSPAPRAELEAILLCTQAAATAHGENPNYRDLSADRRRSFGRIRVRVSACAIPSSKRNPSGRPPLRRRQDPHARSERNEPDAHKAAAHKTRRRIFGVPNVGSPPADRHASLKNPET